MDSCRVKLGGIRSLFSDCGSEARYNDWSNQINSRSDQLVCPQPRRSFNGRSQFNFDSCRLVFESGTSFIYYFSKN